MTTTSLRKFPRFDFVSKFTTTSCSSSSRRGFSTTTSSSSGGGSCTEYALTLQQQQLESGSRGKSINLFSAINQALHIALDSDPRSVYLLINNIQLSLSLSLLDYLEDSSWHFWSPFDRVISEFDLLLFLNDWSGQLTHTMTGPVNFRGLGFADSSWHKFLSHMFRFVFES